MSPAGLKANVPLNKIVKTNKAGATTVQQTHGFTSFSLTDVGSQP
jgi:hypothetical protein